MSSEPENSQFENRSPPKNKTIDLQTHNMFLDTVPPWGNRFSIRYTPPPPIINTKVLFKPVALYAGRQREERWFSAVCLFKTAPIPRAEECKHGQRDSGRDLYKFKQNCFCKRHARFSNHHQIGRISMSLSRMNWGFMRSKENGTLNESDLFCEANSDLMSNLN